MHVCHGHANHITINESTSYFAQAYALIQRADFRLQNLTSIDVRFLQSKVDPRADRVKYL